MRTSIHISKLHKRVLQKNVRDIVVFGVHKMKFPCLIVKETALDGRCRTAAGEGMDQLQPIVDSGRTTITG